jgi:hypothetical protein
MATDICWFSTRNLRFADTVGLLLEMFWPGLDLELLDSSQWAGTIQVLPHKVRFDHPEGHDGGHVDR